MVDWPLSMNEVDRIHRAIHEAADHPGGFADVVEIHVSGERMNVDGLMVLGGVPIRRGDDLEANLGLVIRNGLRAPFIFEFD